MTAKQSNYSDITTFRNYQPTEGEVNSGELKFIPNETMTIRQLIERGTNTFDKAREPIYLDHIDFDDDMGMFRPDLDLTDMDSVKEHIIDLKDRIEEYQEQEQIKQAEDQANSENDQTNSKKNDQSAQKDDQ